MSRKVLGTAMVVALLALAGCRDTGVEPDPVPVPVSSPTVPVPVTSPTVPVPVSSPTVAPVGEPVTFHVRLGAGQRLTTRASQPDRCPGLDAQIDLGSDGTVWLAAYAANCSANDNAQPGNGRHGVYRTTGDIPAERRSGATIVHTALGEATVFTQTYYECTNSCKNYTEPVAVITFDHPRDPAFATLVAYSPKGSVGLDRLTEVLRDQLLT